MKLLALEQIEQESKDSNTESQVSGEEQLSSNISQEIMKEQKNLHRLRFFDDKNMGWNAKINMNQDQSPMIYLGRVKKIKKFQPKVNSCVDKKKVKSKKNNILQQIVMQEVLGLVEEL